MAAERHGRPSTRPRTDRRRLRAGLGARVRRELQRAQPKYRGSGRTDSATVVGDLRHGPNGQLLLYGGTTSPVADEPASRRGLSSTAHTATGSSGRPPSSGSSSTASKLPSTQRTSTIAPTSVPPRAISNGCGFARIDWMRMSPYPAGGYVHLARPRRRGPPSIGARSTGTATAPGGYRDCVQVRTVTLPTPDGTWSGFAPVDNGADIPGTSRYIQYRATLTTGDTGVTPSLDEVALGYVAAPLRDRADDHDTVARSERHVRFRRRERRHFYDLHRDGHDCRHRPRRQPLAAITTWSFTRLMDFEPRISDDPRRWRGCVSTARADV